MITAALRRSLWLCLRIGMPEVITRRVERAYRNRHDRERMLKYWEREYAEATARMAEAECRGERPFDCLAGEGPACDVGDDRGDASDEPVTIHDDAECWPSSRGGYSA